MTDSTVPASPANAANGLPSPAAGPIDVRGVALTIIAVTALLFLLRELRDVVIPLVLAGLLFYALDPFVDWLERRRVPRIVAAAFALLLVIGAAGALALTLRAQAVAVVDRLPQAAQKLRQELRSSQRQQDAALDKVQTAAREIEETAKVASGTEPPPRGVTRVQIEQPAFRVGDYVWSGTLGALAIGGQVIMVLFLAFFLLLSDDLFKRKLVTISSTFTRKRVTVEIVDEIAVQIERFLMVQILTSAIVGVATWLALMAVGFEQAAFWGLVSGVMNSVPYFGPVIVTAGLASLAYLQFGTLWMVVAVAGIALAITTLEGWLLTPVLMSRVASMNQVAVFVGLIFWSWLWGVWGLLLAVPMLMVIKAVCDRVEGLQPIGTFLGE
ncbi:MAG TPA: AI-2E family transporter [Vicinamibacterales bacterium]